LTKHLILGRKIKKRETGDRRRETGDGRREAGDGRQETGGRRQETGDRNSLSFSLAFAFPPLLFPFPSF